MSAAKADTDKARWGELFQGDRAIYTVMVMLGVVLFSIQILIITTIMPTVVADIGGASYYVWASMLYQVGAIVGAACVGPLWRATGMRNGFLITSTVYALGTLGCALAPDMLVLNVSRTVQGLAGGLVTGGTMGVVSRLFLPSQRTRVLALYQGTWTICSLFGPFVGGGFAELGWWRGSFWATIPLALIFGAIAWWKIPAGEPGQAPGRADDRPGIPLLRLALLAFGVLGIAVAGQLSAAAAVLATLTVSLVLIWAAFRIDARETHRLFPTRPLSIRRAVGLGYWMLILVGGVQAAITVFMPLQLQTVYGLRPIWVGVANLVVSTGWTISTFLVSGWSGSRERFALNSGPVLILISALMLLPTVGHDALWLIMAAMFVFGWGIGSHNVHLGARVMGNALKGEESITAASQSMMRSLGGAIGTAAGGLVANMAGLGAHIDIGTVNDGIFAVYVATILPLLFGVVFIVRMTRLVVPRGATPAE